MITHLENVPELCPMTEAQLGVYMECLKSPESLKYNMPGCIRLGEDTDIKRYCDAVRKVAGAHPAFGITAGIADGVPSMRVKNRRIDIDMAEADSIGDELKRFVRPFNLENGPLYRFEICCCGEGTVFLFDVHHLIFDDASREVFINQIEKAYDGGEIASEELTVFDVSEYEKSLKTGEAYRKAQEFFRGRLEGVSVHSLPDPDRLCGDKMTGCGSVTADSSGLFAPDDVGHFTKVNGITENILFLGAFAYALKLFSGSDEVCFAAVNNGRHDRRLAESIGMFAKTLPLYFNICEDKNSTDFLKDVQSGFLETVSHDCISFGELVSAYGVSPDILFAYQAETLNGAETPDTGETISAINVMVFRRGTDYQVLFRYDADRYTKAYIESLTGTFMHIVSGMFSGGKLADINLLSPGQKECLDGFNRTEVPYDTDKTVVSLFREKAEETPDAAAVIFNDRTYTYREADRISDNIAVYLMNRGIGREDVVSVLIGRSEYMPIASLGVLKAGAAYQPLDPGYPEERLAFMVQDSGAKLLIADSGLRDRIPGWNGETLLTEDILALPDADSGEREKLSAGAPEPENLFILLYTSGSTGTPKGVMLEHRNITAFCHWYRSYFDMDESSCAAAYASYGFDACMMDMYPVLTAGGRLVIIPEDIRLDMIRVNELFREQKVTHAFMTTQVGRQFVQLCDSPYLKHLSVGGETLVPVEPPRGFEFHNGYGPTECTVYSTVQPVDELFRRVPIGRPLNNMKLYVVDKNMRRLPAGVPGELCIAGHQISRGYLNRPEKTAEVYVPNPFDREKGYERIYRTGDIVRILPDGRVDFVGRNDGQVKIRGFRVELTEVEEVIRRFAGISDATVVAFDAPGGGRELCAYIVSPEPVDVRKLKEFIRDEKPSYMVPEVIMQIDMIPLNQNQKVNRRALPVPELTDVREESSCAPSGLPLNALETELRSLAAQVVGTENFGLTEKLSHLGLTSISAIRLATLIYKKYGVSVKALDLIDSGTVRSIEDAVLTAWMSEREKPENDTGAEKKGRTEDEKGTPGHFPLSFSQQGVYAECQGSPDSTQYNVPFCAGFPAGVSADELKTALREVVMAHPSFSLRFTADENNETVQYFAPDYEPEINVKKMSGEDFEKYRKEFVRPFSLTGEPLARFEIVEADRLYLLVDVHHLITDGTSYGIFFSQLSRCLEGAAPETEEYSYFDYVEDEKIAPETEKYFEEQMAELEEATQLIPDVFEPDCAHTEGIVSIPTDISSVCSFASLNDITPASVYLAAEYIACSRFTFEDYAAIATISSGRSNLRISNTLGMFVNTLPLGVKIDNQEETLAFLKRVSEGFAGVIRHENYPFAMTARKFDFHPSVSYAYQVGVIDRYFVRGEEIRVESLELGKAKLPVSVFITGSPESGGHIQVNYDEALFTGNMMRSFAESMENAVRGLMSAKTLSEISLTDERQWKVLDSYNRPFDLGYDHSDTAVSLFRKQAGRHPDKIAAVYKDRKYTYRELDDLTDRIAGIIYDRVSAITGKKDLAEEVVSIITSRNENIFILPLAVLKSGCGYEPLDRSYPAERLNFMVRDSGARLLIAEDGLAETVDQYTGAVLLTGEIRQLLEDGRSCCERIPQPKPENLLIMLYTSGTTGTPKGVQLEHGNLVAYAYGSSCDGFYTEDSRTAAYASFGFDVNMADTFCTLLNGGTLVVIPEEMRMNLDDLAAYFDEAGITEVLLTTQVGVQFLSNYPELKTLRTLTVGGEKLPAIDTDGLSYRINNGYGPTENCCGVSLFPIRFWEPNIPIGKPMKTINGFILDKTGHRLPAGAAGEYCLSGPQVSRGYLNRPDKTAEVFEPCPFNGFRMYHTGDIVRYRENGDVEFVGRRDGQVKIRGFRVELKEVEAVIREFEGISDVTVQAYDYESGGKYLAAFIVSPETVDIKALNEYVKSEKPAYMVPAVTMQIDAVPLTINHKVDRKQLPKPVAEKTGYAAPSGKAEEDFCRIFGEILGIDGVGAEDDFFDIGGSSISAMKVVLAAGKAGYTVVYQDVFDYSTPRLLAAYTGAEKTKEEAPAAQTAEEQIPTGSIYGPGTTEKGRDGYDYTEINGLLRKNTLDAFRSGERKEIRNILLAGSTGFLGIHVLREFLTNYRGKVYCLVRSKNGVSGESRQKELLKYYFDNDYAELFGKRIFIAEGDATDTEFLSSFNLAEKDITVVNCAANVAHFAKGDTIERANVDSVNNLIDWCVEHGAPLVHISTCSVAGSAENNIPPESFRLTEHVLYAGQVIENNQYIHSKFLGERAVYDAILHRGLRAKVIRMSNLAPRYSDGMFQINRKTNNFMNTLAAYKAIGMVSYDMMSTHTEFSPIDCVSRAVLLLASTPEACTCFMLTNPNQPFIGNVMLQLSTEEAPVRVVEPEEMAAAIQTGLNDPEISEKLSPLLAYSTKSTDNLRLIELDGLDSTYTTQVLYRLGFVWPVTDDAYVRRFIDRLNKLDFFK